MPQLLTSLEPYPAAARGGAVSVGNFDGIHLGHAALVKQLVALAKQVGGPAVVMTFDPPPAALLFPDRPLTPPLTTIARRAELLFALGVDYLIAYPTDHQLLRLSADEFFQQKMVAGLHAQAMLEGPNFHFGRDRQGDIARLSQLCQAAGMQFQVAAAAQDAQGLISSTRIRKLLAEGEVRQANLLLTQPYQIQGIISKGAGRGSGLGFPTANLEQLQSLVPSWGVYAGRAQGADFDLPAAINIGPNPTFDDNRSKLEVHIIGYRGPSLYGDRLNVVLTDKIRDVQKFDSVEALRRQVAADIAACDQRG